MTQIIETDEAGRLVLPPELLGEIKPHSRYTVETVGTKLIVEPEESLLQRQRAYEQWQQEWDALSEQITADWKSDKTAAEILSEMRDRC